MKLKYFILFVIITFGVISGTNYSNSIQAKSPVSFGHPAKYLSSYNIERVNIDGIWYIVIISDTGDIITKYIDPIQNG